MRGERLPDGRHRTTRAIIAAARRAGRARPAAPPTAGSTRCCTASGPTSSAGWRAAGHAVRVYVPYGADWYGYFMRRLAERPANVALLRSAALVLPADHRPSEGPRHGRRHHRPRTGQRAGPRLRARHRRSGPRCRRSSTELAAEPRRADRDHRRRAAHGRRRARSTSSSRTTTRTCSAPRRNATAGRRRAPRSTPRRPPRPAGAALSFDDRAAVFLKAADLLAGPWRDTHQRRDHARPVQDRLPGRDRRRLRADRLLALQRALRAGRSWPSSRCPRPGVWNRIDHRPLEGFVYAITPFNFTAIAGNLPTAPALMGNVVVWKPSPTQQLAAHCTMRLLEEAGLPPGVINLVTGDGLAVSEVALAHPRPGRHPLHRLDPDLPAPVADGRREHRRPTAATRGWSARPAARTSSSPTRRPTSTCCATALVRGAFEYQGQKCSAASRAYVPALGLDAAAATTWSPRPRR